MSDSNSDDSDSDSVQVTFPAKTIARLLAENFTRPETRVSASAVETAAEYLRIFTREAVWRTEGALKAAEAPVSASSAPSSRARIMEASDLEKIAGTLVLDF
ncbi:centromere protein X [Myxozyma melibiosi]|uniref:Centromere protein X n=1 Tax=Myxozyma melibiosi TaxID=54550 RepID=A0ABR1EYL0_9ASCO